MANSVNTNPGALVALRSLRTNTGSLDRTSKKVETGYRVADASDDAAVFAVAQGVRGNIKAYASVQSSLSGGVGLGEVTMSALTGISNLIGDIKAKIANLADGSLTTLQQDIYRNDTAALIGQIRNYVSQANYNGKNLLNGDGAVTPLSFVADVTGTTLDYQVSYVATSHVDIYLTPGPWTLGSDTPVTDLLALTPPDTTNAEVQLDEFERRMAYVSGEVAAQQRAMEQQKGFVDNMVDAMKTGLGALVDADVAAESAALESARVAQQLSEQALSIANQQPNTLLKLLR